VLRVLAFNEALSCSAMTSAAMMDSRLDSRGAVRRRR
jgi:hypothetical protein